MPPRKPRSSPRSRYETGAEYPSGDEQPPVDPGLQDGPDFLGDGPLPPSAVGRDLYGENDYPDGQPEDPELFQQTNVGIRAPPPPAPRGREGETRVAPVPSGDETERTGVDSPDATRAGRPLKLEVIDGPDAGKVIRLAGVRCVVGRSPECDLSLKDHSASRRHVELVVDDEGVMLRDLGSGNGTRVNGEKATEQRLVHGDEISLGKTVIRFLDEVAAFQKAQAEAEAAERAEQEAIAAAAAAAEAQDEVTEAKPPPARASLPAPHLTAQVPVAAWGLPSRPVRGPAGKRRKMLGIFAALAGAMVLLLVALILRPGKPPPPMEDVNYRDAMERLQRARNAAREGRFAEAASLAETAEKVKPGVDPDGFAARARQEAAAEAALAVVRTALEEGLLDEARAGLDKVQFVTPSGEALKGQVDEQLKAKVREQLAAKLEAALAAPDLAEAQLLLLEMAPAQLREAQPKVEALKARLEQEEAARAQAEKQQQRRAVVVQTERRKAEMKAAFESVQRRFGEGDYARAALECDRVAERNPGDEVIRARAKLLKSLLPAFGKSFEEGHRKFKQGQLGAAARPLKRARDLYTQMGMEGALGRVLDEELASSAVAAAESALAREDWVGAHTFFEEALKLSPGDERAAAGQGQVRRKLEEVYLSAYMLAEREPKEALSRLRTVLSVARPGEPLFERATALKGRLQP